MNDLVRKWHAAETQRAKAVIEAELWDARPEPGKCRPAYLMEVLGLSEGIDKITARQALFNAGPLADVLWDRVDAENSALPVRRAATFLCAARKKTGPLDAALVNILAEYDALPLLLTNRGKLTRRRNTSRIRRPNDVAVPRSPSSFWAKLRLDIGNFAADRLVDLSPFHVEQLTSSLERDLKILFEEWQVKISEAKNEAAKAAQPSKIISRRRLVQVCTVLSLTPPRIGEPPNMVLGKKRWRRLANEYHPDKHGGATVDQFHAVKEAWRTLQEYDEQLKNKEKTNGIERG